MKAQEKLYGEKARGYEWQQARKRVLARDGRRCQKCGHKRPLEVHHIIALRQGGTHDEANLITLCAACHAEWDAIETTLCLDFAAWLALPPGWRLVGLFSRSDLWSHDISAAQMREMILIMCGSLQGTMLVSDLSVDDDAGNDDEDDDAI